MALPSALTNLGYLVAIALFIMGIKRLGRVRTARGGNRSAAWGMALAILLTLPLMLGGMGIRVSWTEVLIAVALGALIGGVAAKRVVMTQMPQLVALFNGFGGLASMLVALGFFFQVHRGDLVADLGGAGGVGVVFLTVLIGGITLTGSYIAFAKLDGRINGSPIVFKGQHPLNALLMVVLAALPVLAGAGLLSPVAALYAFTGLALALGVLITIP
ncbi:NAD(P)(+) transhydrogenase (Re/Si-specific) subunit beta, partial [bacterium]|nr:NAD(P)(+) transhydrogenase (Re/Si-specific) subunit beta [bacterium]